MRLLVVGLACALAACGSDSPTAPSPTTGSGTAVSIPSDGYTGASYFTPTTLTTTVGSTVVWTNMDADVHSTVSNTGLWSSSTMPRDGTFSFQFNTPGTFPYRCTQHPTMTGTIVVQ